MSGWFVPNDADWWPAIRESILKPWPREAAMMDLRWHADAAALREGKRRSEIVAFPGRPTFVARWGWTDWEVKKLLRTEEWVDTWTARNGGPADGGGEAPAPKSASGPPARRQRTASAPPVPETTNAENIEDSASGPPADRQRAASGPPRAFSSDRSPETVDQEPPVAPPPAVAGSASGTPPADGVTRPPKPDPRAELYAVYQRAQPARSPTPTPKALKAMGVILREAGSPERAGVFLAWAHQSQDRWARQLRGEEPWPDGECKRRMSPESLAGGNLGARMDDADAWDARGRTEAPLRPTGRAPPGGRGPPGSSTPPSPVHARPNPFGEPDAPAPDPSAARRGDLAGTQPLARPG